MHTKPLHCKVGGAVYMLGSTAGLYFCIVSLILNLSAKHCEHSPLPPILFVATILFSLVIFVPQMLSHGRASFNHAIKPKDVMSGLSLVILISAAAYFSSRNIKCKTNDEYLAFRPIYAQVSTLLYMIGAIAYTIVHKDDWNESTGRRHRSFTDSADPLDDSVEYNAPDTTALTLPIIIISRDNLTETQLVAQPAKIQLPPYESQCDDPPSYPNSLLLAVQEEAHVTQGAAVQHHGVPDQPSTPPPNYTELFSNSNDTPSVNS